MDEQRKPHISKSQLEMFLKCPEQYRRRYIEGEKRPPSIHAHRGSGFHGGVEVNYRQKIETHEDLPTKEIVEAAAEVFDNRVKMEGTAFSKEEISVGIKKVIGEHKDMTVRLATFWADNVAASYQPTMIEETIRVEMPQASRDLFAIIDIAAEGDLVIDMKTAAKSKPKDAADQSTQLTINAVCFKAKTGRFPEKVILDTIVDSKSGTKRQLLKSERDVDDIRALSNKLNVVMASIETGLFPPAPEGSWWCSEKWCGYWGDCAYVNPKRFVQIDLGSG